MTRRLLLAVSPGEIWAMLVEGDAPVALRVARTEDDEPRAGDLYLGRVVGARPELPAVLVDIGAARPGFLGGADAAPETRLDEGAAVIVKVRKAAHADKAAGLTMKLSPAERPLAVAAAAQGTAPLRLYRRETALGALLREFTAPAPDARTIDEIVTDDAAAMAEAKRAFAGAMRLHSDPAPLFEAEHVGSAIAAALAPRVALPAGGAITLEATAAATMIDVDGGRGGALAANLNAAVEIARQIRLRDLAGPIVIDFIGMKEADQRARVAAALKQALGLGPHYLGWTRLGHFELVVPRRRASLTETLFDGTGQKTPLTVALEALRHIQRESRHAPGKRFALHAHPDVAACLDGAARGARRELEARLGYALKITAEARARDTVAIVPALPISTSS